MLHMAQIQGLYFENVNKDYTHYTATFLTTKKEKRNNIITIIK
jgi:hypothetical protein